MVLHVLEFVVGLVGLYLGADWLIRGSSRIARDLGVNALVIGLTVVAMGTSTPELLIGLVASLRGSADLTIGNVVGSNIANIALILGIGALIRPIHVQARFMRRDVPVMIGAAMLFYFFAANGALSRWDGLGLSIGFVAYIVYLLRGARDEPAAVQEEYRKLVQPGGTVAGHSALTALGLLVLLGGAHMVVTGASDTARLLGISELAIGLTVVALGTSLPELATAVAASVRDEGDILVGNIVGSNVFNVFAVLGFSAAARPLGVRDSVLFVEAPIMLGLSVILIPFVWSELRLTRLEGAILLAVYGGFVIWLALPY